MSNKENSTLENDLNEVLKEIKEINDYNSEEYNVNYAIVAFLTYKDDPNFILARNIITRISHKDSLDTIKLMIDSAYFAANFKM